MTASDENFLYHTYGEYDAGDAAEEMALRLEELGFENLIVDAVFLDTTGVLYNIENAEGSTVTFMLYLVDESDSEDPETEGMVTPMAVILNPDDEGDFLELDLSDIDVEIDPDCDLSIPDVFDLSWMNKSLAKALLSSDLGDLTEDTDAPPPADEPKPSLLTPDGVRSRGGRLLKTDTGFFTSLPIHKKSTSGSPQQKLYRRCKVLCTQAGWR